MGAIKKALLLALPEPLPWGGEDRGGTKVFVRVCVGRGRVGFW